MKSKLSILLSLLLSIFLFSAFAPTRAEIQVIPVQSQLYGFEVSPDGTMIATYESGIIHNDEVLPDFLPLRLLDVATGTEKFALSGHTDYALDIAFSSDNQWLVAVQFNGLLNVWNTADGTLSKQIQGMIGVNRIAFLPNTTTLLMVSSNTVINYLLLMDIETGYITRVIASDFATRAEFMEQLDQSPNGDLISAVGVAPDGQSVVLVKANGQIERWSLVDGTQTVLLPTEDSRPYLYIRNVVETATGVVYSHSEQEKIFLLDSNTGELKSALDAKVSAVSMAVAPDGDAVAWVEESTLNLARLSQPQTPPTQISLALGESMSVRGQPMVAFLPDGSHVVVGGYGNLDNAQNAIYIVKVN